jgi:hypothetical protein
MQIPDRRQQLVGFLASRIVGRSLRREILSMVAPGTRTVPIQWWMTPCGTGRIPFSKTGATTVSPRLTRRARSGDLSIHKNDPFASGRDCMRTRRRGRNPATQ